MKIELVCPICGKFFSTYPCCIEAGNGKYCSKACVAKAQDFRIEVKCQQCGCITLTSRSRVKLGAKFCSRQCYGQSIKGKPKKDRLERVNRICQQCGNFFLVKHSQVKYSGAKFCSQSCTSRYYANRSTAKRIHQQCPVCGVSLSFPLGRIKQGRKCCSNRCRLILLHRELGKHISPTKPEIQLKAILDKHYPQFKYNGDFSMGVMLGNLIPDFVNVNSRKEVIEVFGDYWHSRDNINWNYTELGRLMAYNSVGFRCLVIWEGELGRLPEEQLVNKIKVFITKGRL